jgi:ribonuclease P protein component
VRDPDDRSSLVVERLKRRSDFQAMASGVRISGGAFVLQARARGDEGTVRIGFTVSRQVGGAVERNRVRRRLREIVRMSVAAGGSGLCPGHDYVLIGRRAALSTPFGEMMRALAAALTRVQGQDRAFGREGTGGRRLGPLHEAGSPSRPSARHGNRKQSPPASPAQPSRGLFKEPPDER